MKPGRIGAGSLLALLLAAGCGGNAANGRRIGGETNWLVTCSVDSDCGVGQCLCNVCTVSCVVGTDSCSAGPPGSRCAEASELGSSCVSPSSGGVCVAPKPDETSLDGVLGVLQRDLLEQSEADRPFVRYLSLASLKYSDSLSDTPSVYDIQHRSSYNRGLRAVTELANSLSLSPTLSRPTVVDEERQLIRIDLRDYGWDRTFFVNGREYADAWQAIVDHAALAITVGPSVSPNEVIDGLTWLYADDFVAAAGVGDLYYDLLGLPHTQLELEIRLGLGSGLYRAALDTSLVSTSPRAVEWVGDQQEPAHSHWRTLDFQTAARGQAIFGDQGLAKPDGSELMFTLPNGLFGFFIADSDGTRVSQSTLSPEPIADPMQQDSVMRSAVSCFSCHNNGVVPFDATAAMDQLRKDANDRYARAIEALGDVDPQDTVGRARLAPDSVSLVYSEFERDGVDLEQAASVLLVSPETLRARLPELPALGALASVGGTLPRNEFNLAYRHALCTLHATEPTQVVGCAVP